MVVVIVGALALGFVLIVAIFVEQRFADTQLGGRGQRRLLQEALYTGTPPPDINRERWIAYLRRRRPPRRLVIHAAAVSAVLIGVTVRAVSQPGQYGSDEVGHLVLLMLTFALVYGFWWRVLRGAIGWDQPAKQELLAELERDNRERPHDL